MNYQPNTTTWHQGAIVLHDADRKDIRHLMEVVYAKPEHDLYVTRYVFRQCTENSSSGAKGFHQEMFTNDGKFLLDPRWFGIYLDRNCMFTRKEAT